MTLSFTKMQGLGNDFVVFDAVNQSLNLNSEQIRQLADRRFGVGCDQVLLVEPPLTPGTDFYYRIFNADGSEVEQCGNGARCLARFVLDQGLSDKVFLSVGTRSGAIALHLEDNGLVRVNMGCPELEPSRIPFLADMRADRYTVKAGEEEVTLSAVSMGNPHAVIQVEETNSAPVEHLGPLLESHPLFPQRANVGFMAIRDRDHINLRVYERGAGETLACGSGACAAVVAGHLLGLLNEQVEVSLLGGKLVVSWAGEAQPVWMSGPAVRVFEGEIEL